MHIINIIAIRFDSLANNVQWGEKHEQSRDGTERSEFGSSGSHPRFIVAYRASVIFHHVPLNFTK